MRWRFGIDEQGREAWWRPALRFLFPAVMFLLVASWALLRLEHGVIYHPTPLSGTTPADHDLPYEDVRLHTDDGETLRAWWMPRPDGEDAPVLLFLHGNAGNRADRLHNVAGLWHAGIAVLIIDYRGYADSTGTPGEAGLIRDAVTAFDWLAERTGRPVNVFGRSLGGAVATRMALQCSPARLILESTFTSAKEMARVILPIPGLHLLLRARYDALDAMQQLRMPLMVIHGSNDELVPYEMGERLFNAAASPDKVFHRVRGGMHNDTYYKAGNDYWRWMREFLGIAGNR